MATTKIDLSLAMKQISEKSWRKKVFIGIVLFVIGLVWWAAKVGLIREAFLFPTLFMVVGILFVLKGLISAWTK